MAAGLLEYREGAGEDGIRSVKIMHKCCHTDTIGRFFEIFRLSYGNISR
jgi:hypothetical protein